ncbi:uncharacterized protein LOC142328921 [Lycorma delicatula]|uniref:uncharacterized protein LOC142328921 n=1 Tax=Lycorma delicatula TaxID=130591 RepID=UPI003F51945D
MAIIKSCCCWRSLRNGCYASAIYTGVYFLLTFVVMFAFVYEESHYYSGQTSTPKSPSILEPDEISPTTMTFQLVILCSSSLGVITSILLVYGIFKDKKEFLVPWILTVTCTTLVDVSHSFFMAFSGKLLFIPVTAILYTADFFILSLNVYCLLCVISQYQEYKAGRGTADFCRRPLPVRYTPRPVATVTTCDSTRRPRTNSSTLDLPSPSGFTSADSDRQSTRKHVQFGGDISPDLLHAHWKETNNTCTNRVTEGNSGAAWILPGDNRLPNLDTVPLICTPSPSPTNEKK